MNQSNKSKIITVLATLLPFVVTLGFLCYEATAVFVGTPVSLTVTGYDPADILRGHYIRYELLLEDVELMESVTDVDNFSGTQGYLSIVDSNGDGIYDSLGGFYWNQKPEVYIKAECYRYSESYTRFFLVGNQGRYYLDEKIAYDVEKAINQHGSFQIQGTILDGLFRATGIVVDGVEY